MKKANRVLYFIIDGFFLFRPVVIIPVWGFALFGYFKGCNGRVADLPGFWHQTSLSSFIWIVIFSIAAGSVYVFNQIADIEVDKNNGGLPLLASGIVSRSSAWILAIAAAVISVAVPAIAGRFSIAVLSASTILIGLLYSFRPAFFSGRFLLDFTANAIGFGCIAFGCGWSLAGRHLFSDHFFFSASLPYFFLMCAGSISSTLSDIPGDRQGEKFTTAVVLGEKKAHLLALVFIMAASIDSLMVKDTVAFVCSGFALPFYLLFIIRPTKVFAESTYKVGGALCMIAAGCIFPLFFISAFAVFAATWIYFRVRHGVAYPSLVPIEKISQSTDKSSVQ